MLLLVFMILITVLHQIAQILIILHQNLIDNDLTSYAHTAGAANYTRNPYTAAVYEDFVVTLSQNYELTDIQSVVLYNRIQDEASRLVGCRVELLDSFNQTIAKSYIIYEKKSQLF